MSWKVSRLVREARLAGLYKDLAPTEFFVLREMADACRHDSVVASISMSELETLTGLSRTTMSRAVRALITKECIRRTEYGSQGQASKYEFLAPESRSANATYARSADATWWEPDHVAYHVASESDHVANAFDHVAPTQRPRSAHATNPVTELTIPSTNPETESRARARARARELVDEWIPGKLRAGGRKRMLIQSVMDGVAALGEEATAQLVAAWLDSPHHYEAYSFDARIREAVRAVTDPDPDPDVDALIDLDPP